MTQQLSIFQNTRVRNLIIFSIVSAFAIQALLLIVVYGHDIPLSDDGDQIFLGYLIANNYEITTNDFIEMLKKRKPSVSSEMLNAYNNWSDNYEAL